nr:PHB depolymerase family esterase [Spinactinospora alkalitolerans]
MLLALAALLLLGGVLGPAPRAHAAELQEVTGFGGNPGNLGMYVYAPDAATEGAPMVVLLHGCSQDAGGYHANSGWREYADDHGAVLVYAEQRSANNASGCFNWFQPGDVARGSGEALSIRQMVDHAAAHHATGAVYVSGLSAGGAMASEVLAAYPGVFAGGGVVAGLPSGCAASLIEAFTCMNSSRQQTPQQWGEAVRAKNPGWDGPWPRVAIWHGTADHTVVPANAEESRDQWTDVHGADQTPDSTADLPGPTAVETYTDGSGTPVVARFLVQGMGHGTPVDPGSAPEQCGAAGAYFLDTVCSTYYTAQFWGIAGGADPGPDPGPEPDPDPEPGDCVTADNYRHVLEGRAVHELGRAYAKGSGDDLGLMNVFVVTSLSQTRPGHWEEVGGC